ncbi:hypothetical protein AB0M20_44230, partial [Actinoplanes sp. NPDC051633]
MSTTAALLLPSPARAEVDGVEVKMTELPGEFEAGDDAEVVEAVVSTENDGRCRKVRWSMVLTVDGVAIDDVEVERIEDDGAFPLRVRTEGSTARLTDVRLDPGELCRGRTVTARYRVRFDKDTPTGRVAFNAQAFDAGRTLLAQTSATSKVEGSGAAPSPSASSPAPAPSTPEPDESEEALIPPPADDSGVALDPTAATPDSTPSLLGPALILGALLV